MLLPTKSPVFRSPEGRFFWFDGGGDEAQALAHLQAIYSPR
jgi:hypothetical protein